MLYIIEGPNNSISLSAYSCEDPMYEANHVELSDLYRGSKCPYGALRNMVTNVLRDAKIEFTEE
jgi:hypothetical protein